MFIAVAESIRDAGTVSPPDLLAALLRRYEPARGFGRGMKIALQAFAAGTDWRDVARTAWPEGSRGNGGAVRAGAVALRRWPTLSDFLDAVRLATSVAHAHPDAIDMALLQARLVALLLEEPSLVRAPSLALDARARVGSGGGGSVLSLGVELLRRGRRGGALGRGRRLDLHARRIARRAAHGFAALPAAWIDAIARESPSPAELLDLADTVSSPAP